MAFLLAGLGDDGGLFMPEAWPERSAAEWRALRDLPYADLAATVIHPFVGDTLSLETLKRLCAQAYAGFDHPARVPLVQLDDGLLGAGAVPWPDPSPSRTWRCNCSACSSSMF